MGKMLSVILMCVISWGVLSKVAVCHEIDFLDTLTSKL